MNIKEGLRRIFLSLVILALGIRFVFFVLDGFIIDGAKFENKVIVKSLNTNKQVQLYDFAKEYTNYYYEKHYIPDTKCYPYKQICTINNVTKLKQGLNDFEFETIDDGSFKYHTEKIKLEMPSRFQYFIWQVFDFLCICFWAILAWGIYLLAEKTLIWIFAGFKKV